MTQHEDILAINERFYAAFRSKDIDAMDALLSGLHPVSVIHPGWRALSGREVVLASWRALFRNPRSPEVRCQAPHVVRLDDCAIVICTELLQEGSLVATNIYVKEGSGWRMTHHHAGPGEGVLSEPEEDSEALFH